MEFVTWELLGTYAGAMAMVGIVTELTKDVKFISKIPTQIWSYFLALIVLYAANYFLGLLTLSNAILILFNAVLVSLGANGGYDGISRLFGKEK